ncbi:hypothetical protein MHBO_003697, partial [Bonamia ostreae]
MGAIVRGFDTRAAAREQIESLGGKFLTVNIEESGEGAGGYGKSMSAAFLAAEHDLFRKQAKEVDVIISTALIPGKAAPKLILEDMVASMKPGSVIVDLAAEAGGNCELTQPGKTIRKHGVTIIGKTDFPSKMAGQSSTFYSNNIAGLFLHMTSGDAFAPDMADTITRGAAVLENGVLCWPAPPPKMPPPPKPAAKPKSLSAEKPDLFLATRSKALFSAGAMGALLLGGFAGSSLGGTLSTFALACYLGNQVVWGVTPALHTPLMSVTNAISGITAVGGLVLVGGGYLPGTLPQVFASAAVLLSAINIFGGFRVTE